MKEPLSWAQLLVLGAASNVDYIPFEAQHDINLPYGVWRSLVVRGYLRQHPGGWEITDKGRDVFKRLDRINVIGLKLRQQQERTMAGTSMRYRVARTIGGWAVIDRSITKIKMHNDVVERFTSREAARIRVRELNLLERKTTVGDAA